MGIARKEALTCFKDIMVWCHVWCRILLSTVIIAFYAEFMRGNRGCEAAIVLSQQGVCRSYFSLRMRCAICKAAMVRR